MRRKAPKPGRTTDNFIKNSKQKKGKHHTRTWKIFSIVTKKLKYKQKKPP